MRDMSHGRKWNFHHGADKFGGRQIFTYRVQCRICKSSELVWCALHVRRNDVFFFVFFFAHARTQISQCKNFPGAVPYKQFFWQYFFQGLADRLRIEVYPCWSCRLSFPLVTFCLYVFIVSLFKVFLFLRYLVCDCHSFDRLQCIANAGYPRKTRFLRFHRRDVWFFLSFLSCTNSCLRFCAGRILEFGQFLL